MRTVKCSVQLWPVTLILLILFVGSNAEKNEDSSDNKYNICGLVPKFDNTGNRKLHRRDLMNELLNPASDIDESINERSSPYIAGGYDAKPGEYPSFVSIKLTYYTANDSTCGGVLISDRLVLSAAHCFDGAGKQIYVAPTIISPHLWESGHVKSYEVDKVCSSPKYDGKNHDYAILHLKTPVRLSETVQTVCFPGKPLPMKKEAFAVGIGYSSSSDKPDVVQIIPVRQVACDKVDVHASHICFESSRAKYQGDTCSGDSGGPIYARVGGRMRVYGLTNYGEPACKQGVKGKSVNADVYKQLGGIAKLIDQCMS